MYKGKKIIACVLITVLAVICAVFATGCNRKSPTKPDPSGPDTPPPPADEIVVPSLNETNIEIYVGDEFTLVVSDAEDEIEWRSDDPEIATVTDGKVTGVAMGRTTIKAYVGDYTLTCAVLVRINYEGAPKLVLINEIEAEDGSYGFNVGVNYEYFLHPALYVGDNEPELKYTLSAQSESIRVDNEKLSFTALAEVTDEELIVSCEYNGDTYSVTVYVSSGEVSA